MRVDPQALVKRLTPTATRLLEEAVGRASATHCHEIVVEHLLVRMLETEDSDVALLTRHLELDRKRLGTHVERALGALRTGNAGRPVFSESLFQWFEDAWLLASVELGDTRLRSGVLLAQFIAPPRPVHRGAFSRAGGLSRDELRRTLRQVLAALGGDAGGRRPRPGGGAPAAAVRREPGRRAPSSASPRRSPSGRARGRSTPIFGRHREIRQIVDILARRRKNNPIIVGEPGVGKTALVEGLALRDRRRATCPTSLQERRAARASTSACCRPARA